MEPPIPWLRTPSSLSHPLELDCSFLLSADFYLSGGQGAIEHFCCKDEPSSFPHPLEQGYSFLLPTDFLFIEALIKIDQYEIINQNTQFINSLAKPPTMKLF